MASKFSKICIFVLNIDPFEARSCIPPTPTLEVTRTFLPILATSAFGRKQTSRLSLNGCSVTAALEK